MPGSLTYRFTGDGDRVKITAAAAINNLNPFTMLLWIYPTSVTASDWLVAKYDVAGAAAGWGIVPNLTDKISVIVKRATTDALYTVNTALTINEWWKIAVKFNSANGAGEVINVRMAKLGAALAEPTYSTATDGTGAVKDDSAADLALGNGSWAGALNPFWGAIGPVALFGAELTDAECEGWFTRPRLVVGANTAKMYGRQGIYGSDFLEFTGLTPTVSGPVQTGFGPPISEGRHATMRAFGRALMRGIR